MIGRNTEESVRAGLYRMCDDADLRVRYQLAFTLGEIAGHRSTAALADIARQDAADPWVSLAVLSSSAGRAGELFALLAEDPGWRRTAPAAVLPVVGVAHAAVLARADRQRAFALDQAGLEELARSLGLPQGQVAAARRDSEAHARIIAHATW